ncbi:MAG TPA: formate dehydrogenase subunit gamma [Burkholderiales bacterium]|nr:formate dehydrogenase subunit gamma [Burkholderiales bacterium]
MRRTALGGFLLKLMLAVAFLLSSDVVSAADTGQKDAAAVAAENKDTQAQRQLVQPYNNAPIWREVRSGEENFTTVRGVETGVLVQSGGETWRELRNGPVTFYGGILLIAVPVLIYLYFHIYGALKLHDKPTGRMIQRFSDWERVVHWSTAISFVVLAITGVIILFGKHVILPIFGYTLFSWLAILAKNLHNFVGPLFIFCVATMFVTFIKDNLWKANDFLWFKKAGGMFSKEHVPSDRFNAGEKSWFWFGVFLLSIIVVVTGLILDFPNFEQGRAVMQQANVIHAVIAVIFIAASLGHIYMGTLGVEGAYESMRNGTVDETWAKEHHELWYNDIKSGKIAQKPIGAAGAARARP